ncbi:hypothetical protein LCGC14_1019640 [marine sediment metagenome]|uniref:Baseplate J-like C-terminal domain-containing protein n=1 Tax=marine sediment metagenome TaxID=412755 RepID=A0A0F9MXR8_9ZZZZ
MATEIIIPDFDFSKFYFPEILEALILAKRRNLPELTDENEFEPLIQMLRSFALVGHLNNVLIDLAANESTLPTARLAETVRQMLRLIDFELAPAAPAKVDIVYELSAALLASTEVVNAGAAAATTLNGGVVITFEALTALTVAPTTRLGFMLAEYGGVFTDFTTEANSPDTPADDFEPWPAIPGPSPPQQDPAVKDAVYWGHEDVMFDRLRVAPTTVPSSGVTGVWEYFDGNFAKIAPTSVDLVGATLDVDLTSYIGGTNRQGTLIRVQLNSTTAFEDAFSQWNGSKNFVVVGLLGQSSPSTLATDYTVGSDWEILSAVVDNTENLSHGPSEAKDVDFPLPQTLARNWVKGDVDNKTAFWLRFRIVEVATPISPTLQSMLINARKQFVIRQATQGISVEDSPLGSSTGLANQTFLTTNDFFISNSMKVFVDGDEWTSVDNFLGSAANAEHYVIELGVNDRATIVFGDGVAGRIPPIGVGSIRAEYRVGANNDGNVGAQTVNVNTAGLSSVSRLFNPRQATGWAPADGATTESLEQAKIKGPASLRTKNVAIGPDDVRQLTRTFEDADGARPFSRSATFEEGFGPKTIELVVVVRGGGQASAAQLDELELFFNGDKNAAPPLPKRIVANQEVVPVNFSPKTIDVVATVKGDVTKEEVENRLKQIIQPEALKTDGVTFEWEFGEDVPRSRILHEIFETDESIQDVVLTTPAADVGLDPRELPVLGTISITVI